MYCNASPKQLTKIICFLSMSLAYVSLLFSRISVPVFVIYLFLKGQTKDQICCEYDNGFIYVLTWWHLLL